jgi:hypothetical protein
MQRLEKLVQVLRFGSEFDLDSTRVFCSYESISKYINMSRSYVRSTCLKIIKGWLELQDDKNMTTRHKLRIKRDAGTGKGLSQ